MSREKFRFDYVYNAVYVYDGVGAYIFCGQLNGRTEEEFIRDYFAATDIRVLNEH